MTTNSLFQKETTRTITYQPQYDAAMVNEPTYFEINPHGMSLKDVEVRLQGLFVTSSWNSHT